MLARFLLALLLLSAPALADNTADEADVAFTLGNEAYAKKDFNKALASYFLSYRLVPNRNVLFNIARCYEQLNRLDEAYRYYFDLSVQPGIPADDLKDIKAALKRLEASVALLTVTSTPAGADVYVDREDLGSRGRTPITLALSGGPHTVKLKLPGHRDAEGKPTVRVGAKTSLDLALTVIEGTLALSGTPEGAAIRETRDGPQLATLPANLSLLPGQKLLWVTAPGFTPQQLLAEVKPDQTTNLSVKLDARPPATGKVVVTANRDNSPVEVDGRPAGFTPVVLTLSVGPHKIVVAGKDVKPAETTLEITRDAQLSFDADLRYAPPPVTAASKALTAVDDAPASISVITREEIRAFGWQTLADALQAIRGVFVSNDRIYSYIGFRGFSPPGDLNTRIAILYDGHTLNDVWAGQGFVGRDLDVDLAELERIEIVRGPTSVLYGTGAFFAVINLVPRNSVENKHVEANAGVGALGLVKGRATGSIDGKWGSVLATAAGAWNQGAELTDLGQRGVVRGLDGERAGGGSVRARLGDFTLVGKINARTKDIPTGPLGSTPGVAGTRYTDTRAFAEGRFEHDFGRLQLAVRAFYDASRFTGVYANTGDSGDIVTNDDEGGADWLGLEARARIRLFEDNHLTVGIEAQGQQAFQSASNPAMAGALDVRRRLLVAGTLLDEWRLHRRLSIQAGLRVDKYFDLPGVALSPRLALVGRIYDGGLTKAVVGQAFRAPNVYELYFDDGQSQRAPAGGLLPETITTFELEHSHDLTPELRLTVSGYHNLMDRLVVLNTEEEATPRCGNDTSPRQCLVFGNSASQLTATGAEAGVHWQPGRFTLVDLTWSWVWLNGQSGDSNLSDVRAQAPTHLVQLRALFPLYENALRLSGQGIYQSARGRGPYGESLLIHLGLSGEFGIVRYFAGVQNLLDVRYALPIASEIGQATVPQYGRTFLMELAVSY